MLDGKYLNASEAANYLGFSREWFYTLKEKHNLEPSNKVGNMPLYSIIDLRRIKKVLANEKQ